MGAVSAWGYAVMLDAIWIYLKLVLFLWALQEYANYRSDFPTARVIRGR